MKLLSGLLGNAPARVALDFAPARRQPGWLGWTALAAGMLALVAAAVDAWSAYADIEERADIVARLRAQAGAAAVADGRGRPALLDTGPAFAVASRLNADWAGLFAGVARAHAPEVTLLELHGDAGRGSVRIVAEVPSLEQAFAWLERLQGEGGLRSVTLDSHAWVDEGSTSVVRFNASATWGTAP